MAPAGWTMIGAVLMHCYEREGFGASIVTPISEWVIEFLGTMFVDDTDLIVMGNNLLTSEQVYQETQDSLYVWGDLLLCTGGALKPEKCFWYLVDYECDEGEWKYKATVDWEIMVSVPDGPDALIGQKDVYHCGSFTVTSARDLEQA